MEKELLEKLLKEKKPSQSYEIKINFEQGRKITNLITAYEVLIMYEGQNRNGSYIAKNTAEDMASRLGGVPIVGIYNKEKGDFSMHTEVKVEDVEGSVNIDVIKPTAYGYIPEDAEVYWKDHEDKDGVVRKYLTTTAYLWNGRFEELNLLSEGLNNQSMELDEKTLEWDFVELPDEEVVFAITKADIIGLCILGKDVEPCFEGASFAPLFTDNSFDKEIDKMSAELKFALANYSLDDEENEDNDIVVVINEKEDEKGLVEVEFEEKAETEIEEPTLIEEEIETIEEEEEEIEEEIEPTQEELEQIESEKEEVEEIEEILEDIDTIDEPIDIDEYNRIVEENKELKSRLEIFEAAEVKKEKLTILKRFKEEMSTDDYQELIDTLDDIDINEVEKEAALKAYAYLKASLMEKEFKAKVNDPEDDDEDEEFNFTLDTDPRSPILEDWQLAIKRKTNEQNS